MSEIKITKITEAFACGEGPHWDASKKCLYFVDIPASLICKYDPATKITTTAKVEGGKVGFMIPVKGKTDKFVIGLGLSFAVVTWDGVSKTVPKSDVQILSTVEPDKPRNRFNDGKADPRGRVYAGTMGDQVNGVWDQKQGNLYCLNKSGKASLLLSEISISNGLAWSQDQKTFYYIDSLAYTVDALDYEVSTGKICNRRSIFDLKKNKLEGIPDGMTIDTDGNLWVALYFGSHVIQINPNNGKLLRKIRIPGRDITSVAFMGPNLEELAVTTAYQDLTEKERIPEAGATFIVTGHGCCGCPGIPADI